MFTIVISELINIVIVIILLSPRPRIIAGIYKTLYVHKELVGCDDYAIAVNVLTSDCKQAYI